LRQTYRPNLTIAAIAPTCYTAAMGRSALLVSLACLLTAVPTFAWEEGSLQHDGVTLHYTTEGNGKPIVFLSGGLDVDYLVPAAKCFPAGYKFVFLEQRGTGRSRFDNMNAENMTMKLLADDVDALRSHLHVDRLIVAGHSFGGILAMTYAAEYPNQVDSLILIDSDGATLENYDLMTDNINVRVRPGEDRLNGVFYDRSKVALFHPSPLHSDTYKLVMADLRKHYDVRDGMRRLTRPVLIIHGHQDPVGDKTPEDTHQLNQSSTLRYIDKCGHFPWIEQPEKFQSILAEFLAK
jgi:proline iminopeptidase